MFGLSTPVTIALFAVYIFWGGSYLAMRFAVESMPPFLITGIRLLVAGSIIYLWETYRRTPAPTSRQWKGALLTGLLLMPGGSGGVMWAEQFLSSGITAITIASVPFWITMLSWLWQKEKRPSLPVIAALILGLAGIFFLVKSTGFEHQDSAKLSAYIILLAACGLWALGSLYSRRADCPKSKLQGIAMQMLTGGAACLLLGFTLGEGAALTQFEPSWLPLMSLGYLIIFSSIIGFSAYIWLMNVTAPTVVSTYAFICPLFALVLGWLFAGESLSGNEGVAAVLILLSATLIIRDKAQS